MTTIEQLNGIVERHLDIIRLWEKQTRKTILGYNRLMLQEGSAINGRPFRLYMQKPDSGALFEPPVGGSFLGNTKTEAADTLFTRNNIMYELLRIIESDQS